MSRRIPDSWLCTVLETLYQSRSATRAQIAELSGLHPAGVSQSLGYLFERGVVLRTGVLESNGGRRAEVLRLSGEAGYFIGVDLEPPRIRFALANLVGDIRYRWEQDLESGQTLTVETLSGGIRRVIADLDTAQLRRVLAVGITFPGLLDEENRLTAVNLGWHDFPLRRLRKKVDLKEISVPIFFESDKHTVAMAERWLGSKDLYQNAVYVICEAGIGIGFILGGKLVAGSRNMAGELGHCTIDLTGESECRCGKRGCLESIAAGPSIVREYLKRNGKNGIETNLHVTDVFERARQGDSIAQAVLDRAARALGIGLSTVINLLNPEIVVLGGDLISGEDLLVPRIKQEIARQTLPQLLTGVKIVVSRLGLDIRLKGVFALAFRNTMSDPALLQKICTQI